MRTIGSLLLGLGLAIGIETTILAEETQAPTQQAETKLDEKTKDEIKRLNDYGGSLFSQGKYVDAKIQFEKVVNLDKTNFVALYGLANTHFRLEEFQKAEEFYKSALKGGNNEFFINKDFGIFLCKRARFSEALTYLEVALSKKPDDNQVLGWRRYALKNR